MFYYNRSLFIELLLLDKLYAKCKFVNLYYNNNIKKYEKNILSQFIKRHSLIFIFIHVHINTYIALPNKALSL